MEHDYMKRGYLLPEGCKDLIDVLKRQQKRSHYLFPNLPTQLVRLPKELGTMIKPRQQPPPLPPVKGEIIIPAQTSVSQLATLLGQTPFLIIADLMQMGVFASIGQCLAFETISRIARKYGFIARKAA